MGQTKRFFVVMARLMTTTKLQVILMHWSH